MLDAAADAARGNYRARLVFISHTCDVLVTRWVESQHLVTVVQIYLEMYVMPYLQHDISTYNNCPTVFLFSFTKCAYTNSSKCKLTPDFLLQSTLHTTICSIQYSYSIKRSQYV